jgi:lipooligosaccharide transport system ATP-binding protein
MIDCVGVTKAYGEKKAVQKLSFSVRPGECFSLLGPNGAGKTTMFKMLYGAATPTAGDLFVNGMNVTSHMTKIKGLIGVVPQENGLDPDFTVLDNLLIYGSYHRIPRHRLQERAKVLLQRTRLDEYAHRAISELSGGMKRRLTMARALLSDPQLLLLDEPTTGLDPQARLWIWDEIRTLKREGRTVVLTTHYMEEAELLSDRIVIISKGEIVAEGTPLDLITSHIGSDVVEFEVQESEINYYLGLVGDRFPYQKLQNKIHFHLRNKDDAQSLLKEINSPKIILRRATLNDVFLRLAGYEIIDG